MKIISEEAGLDLAELGESSEFADYGIDSLLSLTISGRLQEELDLELPSSLFVDYPSVKELATFLDSCSDASPSPGSSEQSPTPEQDTASAVSSVDYQTDSTSVTGGDEVIDVIRAIIAEETGISLEDLTPSTSFSELGIDSLLSLTVMGKLDEVLDMELPTTLLADNDTLGEVEKALGLKAKATSAHQGPVTPPSTLPRFDANTPPHATSIKLQGNPKTATKNLFLFPDGSGSATSYASLPKISPDIVVYGLNCPWMKTPEDMMSCTLADLTAKYLREIRLRQPHGPYYFGGWSAGGICAYEAALQLAAAGEATARLLLIDSPNPIGLENPPARMYDFFETLDFFGTKGKPAPKWLRPHFTAFLQALDGYQVCAWSAAAGGVPAPRTHMIYARDGICKRESDPRPEIRPGDPREMLWLLNNRTDFGGGGWGDLLGKANLQVAVLDEVNHFSMVAPGPKIVELSGWVEKAMR
jgi:naphtho-gamma-pyrone polyketide synthase